MLLAVGQPPPAQLLDTGIVAQGGEHIVQGLAPGRVHLHIAAGHHRHTQFAGQFVKAQVALHLVIAVQVRQPQPDPPLAQARQLGPVGPAGIVVKFRQPDKQAALEMEDHIPQGGPVLPLGTAPPGHADQPGKLAVGFPGGSQRHQLHPLLQVELAAHHKPDARLLRRHVGLYHPGQGTLVGNRHRRIAQRRRPLHQLMRVGSTPQETVATQAVKFGVGQNRAPLTCPAD